MRQADGLLNPPPKYTPVGEIVKLTPASPACAESTARAFLPAVHVYAAPIAPTAPASRNHDGSPAPPATEDRGIALVPHRGPRSCRPILPGLPMHRPARVGRPLKPPILRLRTNRHQLVPLARLLNIQRRCNLVRRQPLCSQMPGIRLHMRMQGSATARLQTRTTARFCRYPVCPGLRRARTRPTHRRPRRKLARGQQPLTQRT